MKSVDDIILLFYNFFFNLNLFVTNNLNKRIFVKYF